MVLIEEGVPVRTSFDSTYTTDNINELLADKFKGYELDFMRCEAGEGEDETVCPVRPIEGDAELALARTKQEIEYHIKRCGFDIDLVVNYLDEDDEGKGVFCDLRVADDHWCTADLNIEKTIPRLRSIDSSCNYEEFLDCIIDNAD